MFLTNLSLFFYSVNNEKGKAYTLKHFKQSGYSRRGIYHILERFDQFKQVKKCACEIDPHLIKKMMLKVKDSCHYAREHGLYALQK